MKGGEYTLSGLAVKEDRYPREFFWSSGLLHLHVGWRDFLLYLVPIKPLVQGGMIFTMLMMDGCDFHYVSGF